MSHSTHSLHAPAGPQAPPDRHRWIALALISVAQFMLILDVTVVNIALPSIGADLHLGRASLTWTVTAYTLSFGGLMLLGGRLADTFGARRMMLTGLTLFTLASLASGLAHDGTLLLAGRAAQGVGAALLCPAALSTVTTRFNGSERNRALGVWAALGGIGFAAGLLIGGILTAGPGWRWVFFVNVPVGVALLATLPSVVPARPGRRGPVDVLGGLIVTAATGSLIYGLVNAGAAGWGAAGTVLPLAAAVAGYGVFAMIERTTAVPLMQVRMLARRPVAAGAFLMLTGSALLISMFFLGSLYLQHDRGISALHAGLLFLPAAVATGIGAHLASRLVGRLGGKPIATTGLALIAAGAGLLTRLTADGSLYTVLLPGIVIATAGVGAVFVTATTSALGHITSHQAGLASGIINTFHELGGAIGVAVASTIAAAGLTATPSITGFTHAYTAVAVTAVLSAALALRLVPAAKPHPIGPHAH
jgi:EmrB/QacA subfamily drug resistance transporter